VHIRLEVASAVSNILTALVALFAVIIAGLTLYHSQRAWIAPAGAEIVGTPIRGKPLTIKLKFENTGKEPAKRVVFTSQQVLVIPWGIGHGDVPHYDPELYKWPRGLKCPTEGLVVNDGATYFPVQSSGPYEHILHAFVGGKVTVKFRDGTREIDTSSVPQEVFDKKLTFLVRGCIHYETETLFGWTTRHATAYCFYMYPLRDVAFWKGTFAFCPTTGTTN
jgi:hypothetical protein